MLDRILDLFPPDIEFISHQAYKTPVQSSSELNARIGRTVHIKDETLQQSRYFKFRGAILGVRNGSKVR